GGYILGGYSASNIYGDKTESSHGGYDYWIVKTDATGNIQWQNTIGGISNDELYSIQQTADGGYILGGQSESNISGDKTENSNGDYDYWIVKTDATGNVQWQNTIGGNGKDWLFSIKQTTDGGYILGGRSDSNISGDKTENSNGYYDYWIVKTDATGNIQWQNTIGGNSTDYLHSVQQTTDGGYILCGYSQSIISGDKTENCIGGYDYWIVKTNATGNIQWQNTIGGNDIDEIYSIQQTADGGYILGGYSASNISGDKTENSNGLLDYWIVKTDATGNIQWQNTLGGGSLDYLTSIQQATDGGYILGGYSYSSISGDKTENSIVGPDYWIVKTDAIGNVQWQNTIGGSFDDVLWSIQQTADGGCILGGYSWSNISGDKTENSIGGYDCWIIKLTDQYNFITGKTFLDLNSNSTQDIGEPSIPNKTITEINTNRFGFTQPNGFYSVSVLDTGNFSVSPTPINYYTAVPVSHAATFTGINQTDSLNDFAFQPLGTFNDLCVTLTPLGAFRQGFTASYKINYENVGTTALNGTVKIYPDNALSYFSSSQTPVSVNADSVVWNVGTLSPFQSGSFVATYIVSPSAPIGSSANSIVQIEPIINDANPACNIDTATVTITGSFDPNDILVNEDTLTTTQLAAQPFLDYTIRFQNTGNDTAFTVKIINPIDTNKLELSSIEFVNSSHPFQLKWINYNRNMEFLFENILLPDSNINELQSHGFITYRIKPKTSLLVGDSITNRGYIYFDFNAPVGTNTATTHIVLPTSISDLGIEISDLKIFPNPANDELNIQINNTRINGVITISIFDILGNIVRKETSVNPHSQIRNLKSFSPGIYFVEVKTGKEICRAKFVKD
ncbi:MAG TPA: T9SS type A sorting domain-containing protein, partial [Bacteroidia bacterium]|nr:T9SS type A sorting domain-containing protein [Bacteroidia bacterium]